MTGDQAERKMKMAQGNSTGFILLVSILVIGAVLLLGH
jgi:hypothetical protein